MYIHFQVAALQAVMASWLRKSLEYFAHPTSQSMLLFLVEILSSAPMPESSASDEGRLCLDKVWSFTWILLFALQM